MLWVLDQLLEEEAAERGAAERSVDQGQAA
jgi:hypothetical protein